VNISAFNFDPFEARIKPESWTDILERKLILVRTLINGHLRKDAYGRSWTFIYVRTLMDGHPREDTYG
jgi:hypothetical protein